MITKACNSTNFIVQPDAYAPFTGVSFELLPIDIRRIGQIKTLLGNNKHMESVQIVYEGSFEYEADDEIKLDWPYLNISRYGVKLVARNSYDMSQLLTINLEE